MTDTVIKTASGLEFAAFNSDATDLTFPSIVNRDSPPTADGTFKLGLGGERTFNSLRGTIVGQGINNAVLTGLRVYGWYPVTNKGNTDPSLKQLWRYMLLAEFAAVMGNINGIAGTQFGSSYFVADTITLVTGNSNVSVEIVSPTNDVPAHFILDLKGAQVAQVAVDLGASLTAANLLCGLQ